jgi:hypothetical protein
MMRPFDCVNAKSEVALGSIGVMVGHYGLAIVIMG